jgi:hypothetical protein
VTGTDQSDAHVFTSKKAARRVVDSQLDYLCEIVTQTKRLAAKEI